MNPYCYYRNSYYSPLVNYSPYTYPNWYVPYSFQRQLPSINPTLFMSSAKHMQIIMRDASTILDKMSSSRKFSLDLMKAAQESNQSKVNELVKDTGIQTVPKVTYTPDGLKLEFNTYVENLDCCHLTLALRWM